MFCSSSRKPQSEGQFCMFSNIFLLNYERSTLREWPNLSGHEWRERGVEVPHSVSHVEIEREFSAPSTSQPWHRVGNLDPLDETPNFFVRWREKQDETGCSTKPANISESCLLAKSCRFDATKMVSSCHPHTRIKVFKGSIWRKDRRTRGLKWEEKEDGTEVRRSFPPVSENTD